MLGFGVGALCPRGTPSVHALWTRSHKHALRVRIVCFTGVVLAWFRPTTPQTATKDVGHLSRKSNSAENNQSQEDRVTTDRRRLPASFSRPVVTSAGLLFDTQLVPLNVGGSPTRHDSAPAPQSQRVERQTSDVQVVSSPRLVRFWFLGPRTCSVISTRLTVAHLTASVKKPIGFNNRKPSAKSRTPLAHTRDKRDRTSQLQWRPRWDQRPETAADEIGPMARNAPTRRKVVNITVKKKKKTVTRERKVSPECSSTDCNTPNNRP